MFNYKLEAAIIAYWQNTQVTPDVKKAYAAKVIIQTESDEAQQVLSDIDNNEISLIGITVYAVGEAMEWATA